MRKYLSISVQSLEVSIWYVLDSSLPYCHRDPSLLEPVSPGAHLFRCLASEFQGSVCFHLPIAGVTAIPFLPTWVWGGSNPALTLMQKALNWLSHFSAPLLFFSLKLFRIQRFRWELGQTREKPRHDGLIRWGHYWFLDTALLYFPTFWFQNTATHSLLCLSDKSLSPDTLCRAHINAQ